MGGAAIGVASVDSRRFGRWRIFRRLYELVAGGGDGNFWGGVLQGAITGVAVGAVTGAIFGGLLTPKGHNIWTGNRVPVSTVSTLKPAGVETFDDVVQKPVASTSNLTNPSNPTGILEPKYAVNNIDKGLVGATRQPITPEDLIEAIGQNNFNVTGKGYLNGNLMMSDNTFANLKSD